VNSWRHLCGTDIFFADRVRGFLSVRCIIVEFSGSLSGLCVPVEFDTVEVSRQGDDPCCCGVWSSVTAYIGSYAVFYMCYQCIY